MQSDFNWKTFLKQESKKAIEKYYEEKNIDPNIYKQLSSEVIKSEWLGFSGASEEQIVTKENDLGVRLTRSYREFLKVTNCWIY